MTAPDVNADVRARFEALALREGFALDCADDGEYHGLSARYAWRGFQMALADLSGEVRYAEAPPTESGWYWHWDGECHRMHFVFNRPGHAYLCTEGEPYGPGQKRNFQAVQRMGGKWSTKVEPPACYGRLPFQGKVRPSLGYRAAIPAQGAPHP